MFTPPPSPSPISTYDSPTDMTPARTPENHMPDAGKRRTGRRMRWAVVVVPLIFVLITASTRYLTHPSAFDIFSETGMPSWHDLSSRSLDWTPHRRHPAPQAQGTSTGASTASLTGTATTLVSVSTTLAAQGQALPTIPSSPPPLPTPFPQPFDMSLQQNFSSVNCFNFFTNMTNSPAFRTCRPFSLLFQSSSAFGQAQSNLTLMNSIIYGTCNATPGRNQCDLNMGWFTDNIKLSCIQDLSDGNAMAVETLTALQAYQVMADSACIADPTSNSYCFVDAVQSVNPADLYYYQLPLGLPLPGNAKPTCSPCLRSIMSTFAAGVQNSTSASLTGLRGTYDAAAEASVTTCGADFAQTNLVNGVASALSRGASATVGTMVLLTLAITMMA